VNRILLPKILGELNFQLETPTDQSVLAYTKIPLESSETKQKMIFSSILLKFSRWAPLSLAAQDSRACIKNTRAGVKISLLRRGKVTRVFILFNYP